MSDNLKKSIVVAAAVVVAITSVAVAILLFIERNPTPIEVGDFSVAVSGTKATEEKEDILKTTETTTETTTQTTTETVTFAPETTRYEPPVTTAHTTTQRITQVIAPGLNEPVQGVMQVSDDLRYSLSLFINNFAEADLESFSYRPSDEQLARFAVSFHFINKRGNFEYLNGMVDINGREYNYRIKKSLIVESIEDYFLLKVNNNFGEGIINYKDGYFYWQFTGAMLYDQIAIVTGLEYTGDDYYKVDFDLYYHDGSNEGMYGYSTAQMQELTKSTPETLFFKGMGSALIKATDIYNYGTYYLYSYDVG